MPRPTPPKPPAERLVTRSEVARLKGIGRSGVSKACRPGGALEPAVRGRKISLDDPAVTIWLTEPTRGPDPGLDTPAALVDDPKSPTKAEMLGLTKRKREAECEKLELANAVKRGALISRELVRTFMFGALEQFTKRLLGDASKSIPQKLFSMARAAEPIEAAQREFRDGISKQLRRIKQTMSHLLEQRQDPPPKTARVRKRARKGRAA